MKKIITLILVFAGSIVMLQANKKPFIFSLGQEQSSDIYQSLEDKNTEKSLFLIAKYPEEIKEALFIMPEKKENIVHLASSKGETRALQALLGLIESLEEKKNLLLLSDPIFGMNVFHHAALGGHLKTLQYLFSEAQSVGLDSKKISLLTNNGGHTIFHFAAQYGFVAMAKFIHSINPDLVLVRRGVNGKQETPLHLAAEMGHLAMVKYLISISKDAYTMKNSNGELPIHLAQKMRKNDVVTYLSSLDTNSNFQSDTITETITGKKRPRENKYSRYMQMPGLINEYKKQKRK